MTKTVREIVREELALAKRLETRRTQLTSIQPTAEFDFTTGFVYIPSLESMKAGTQFVERQLKEEFREDYRKP